MDQDRIESNWRDYKELLEANYPIHADLIYRITRYHQDYRNERGLESLPWFTEWQELTNAEVLREGPSRHSKYLINLLVRRWTLYLQQHE